jgi:CheY-like chemotaxis protein
MAAADLAPLKVLLVEDDDGDVALVEEFFEDHPQATRLRRVTDGVEALRYLRGQGPFAGEPAPDLILLDLNLPRMDGRELLRTLKAPGSPWLVIPVVVLTTSALEEDVAGSYRDHANAFVTKPTTYDGLQCSLGEIHRFFAQVATLYRPERRGVPTD